MMKKIFIYVVLMLLCFNCFSQQMPSGTVTACPYATEIAQPDGEMIDIRIKGNGYIHYLETIDGYTIIKDQRDNTFKYMVSDGEGDLLITDVVVHNAKKRDSKERTFLKQIDKYLRFSGEKLKERKSLLKAHNSSCDETFPSIGLGRALMILIDFPDQPSQHTRNEFNNLANLEGYNVNGQTGSFREYYQDISYDSLTIMTDVKGWYRAPENKDFYGADVTDGNGNRIGDTNPWALARDAVEAAENDGIDFSLYDNDENGVVDVVMIMHSGRGQEESAEADDIWSHKSSIDVEYDGVTISTYIMQAEKYDQDITNIGVLCHEFGHALGLPDLYDTDNTSEGIGEWCVMASGNWNNEGKTPAHMCTWGKIKLGWLTPTVLFSNQTIDALPNINDNDTCYIVSVYSTPEEYFLISNRQQVGWDEHIPGEGLAIWHIDDRQLNNTDEDHYKVHLEQADGDEDLNDNTNRGDDGDLYPGSSDNTLFNDTTIPNSHLYNGNSSFITVGNISVTGETIGFYVNGSGCRANIDLDANNNYQEGHNINIEAGNKITASNEIEDCADVTYDAGSIIILSEGFHAHEDSKFHAFIDGCGNGNALDPKKSVEDSSLTLSNYPNPFTGQTTIEYNLPDDSSVTLIVTDMTGRQISVLVNNEVKTKGQHTTVFDGANYPAGMYYYTIQAGEYSGTQKMILAK